MASPAVALPPSGTEVYEDHHAAATDRKKLGPEDEKDAMSQIEPHGQSQTKDQECHSEPEQSPTKIIPIITEPTEVSAEASQSDQPEEQQPQRHPCASPTLDSGLTWATAATLNVIEDSVTAVRTSISSWTNHLYYNNEGEPVDSTGSPVGDLERAAPKPSTVISLEPDAPMPPTPTFTPITRPLTLMTLPLELQLNIIRQMPFGDIVRLRLTSHHFYHLASPPMLRVTLGPRTLREELLAHCSRCLYYDPDRGTLLRAEPGDDYPFSAKCVGCALRTRDWRLSRRTMGFKVTMADSAECWVCRWCSNPVINGAAQGHAQFHRFCWQKYNLHLVFFFLAGLGQFCAGIVASSLCWRYWRWDQMVFAPATTNFMLMWVVLFMLLLRGNQFRTYGILFLFELTMLGIWVPAVYHIAEVWQEAPPGEGPMRATLVFIGFNVISRLLNVLGNIVLWAEYDFSKHAFPGTPWWEKMLNRIMFLLIFWTYPQSLEQRYREPPPSVLYLKRKLWRKMGDRK